MPKARRVYIKWGIGALELNVSPDLLEVSATNMRMYFEPRSIVVEAVYEEPRVTDTEKHRNIYIGLPEGVKPLEKPPRLDVVGRQLVNLVDIRVVDLGFDRYLTIITPGGFLYDYIVLTTGVLYVRALAKRKVFFEKPAPHRLVAYFL
ncbi:MAG: hypothetical protein ABWW69_01035 [Pyrodictiaceae archaeon]